MIEATIGDLIDNKLAGTDTTNCYLYVVRDGDLVFYVGKSRRGVITRLWEHLGRGWGEESRLGTFIKVNLPESRDWRIEFLTTEECGVPGEVVEGLTDDQWKSLWGDSPAFALPESWRETSTVYTDYVVGQAELALIEKYHPCLNVANNPSPTELPDKYRQENYRPDLEQTVSDFIPMI